MAGLRLPTLKQLQRLSTHDAFEYLASLETELMAGHASLPKGDIYGRRKIEARLRRLQERREEFKRENKPDKQ